MILQGLEKKPIITIWNKIDMIPNLKEQYKFLAQRRPQTIAMSAITKEGVEALAPALEQALAEQMEVVSLQIPYSCSHLLDNIHSLGFLTSVKYQDDYIEIEGKIPTFLRRQIQQLLDEGKQSNNSCSIEDEGDLNIGVDECDRRSDKKTDDWAWIDDVIAAAEEADREEDETDGEDEWDPAKLIPTEDY